MSWILKARTALLLWWWCKQKLATFPEDIYFIFPAFLWSKVAASPILNTLKYIGIEAMLLLVPSPSPALMALGQSTAKGPGIGVNCTGPPSLVWISVEAALLQRCSMAERAKSASLAELALQCLHQVRWLVVVLNLRENGSRLFIFFPWRTPFNPISFVYKVISWSV